MNRLFPTSVDQSPTPRADANHGASGVDSLLPVPPRVAAPDTFPPSTDLTGYTTDELNEWHEKKSLYQNWCDLCASGESARSAAILLGKSPSKFSQWKTIVDREGLEGLLPKRSQCGVKPAFTVPEWFIPACQFFYRKTNRTIVAGSTPEAIRRACGLPRCAEHLRAALCDWLEGRGVNLLRSDASDPKSRILPSCPEELRATVIARERAGKPMLPERLFNLIAASEAEMSALRAPRNTWLNLVQSPGSLQVAVDAESGKERYFEAGEMWTIDDGTINFCCTVPLRRRGNPCWEKFQVIVGRFQFLLVVDHASYAITGWNYTARPRQSYRAEDLVATLHTAFLAHGVPKAMMLEKGISASDLLTDTLGRLDCRIERANSPHQKVVESVFNILWTKLSHQPGQVGRFRGEEEEQNRLLAACQAGHKDPRRHFLSLAEVLRALREAIAEYNATTKKSLRGETWQPGELFARESKKHLRELKPSTAWMFAPVLTQPRLVNGRLVRVTVPVMPGFSEKFHYSLGDRLDLHGRRVLLRFNPFDAAGEAGVIDAVTNEFLGMAHQIDRTTRMTWRTLEYASGGDIGLADTRAAAAAVRRYSTSVGGKEVIHAEERDGVANTTRIAIQPTAAPKPIEDISALRARIAQRTAVPATPAGPVPVTDLT